MNKKFAELNREQLLAIVEVLYGALRDITAAAPRYNEKGGEKKFSNTAYSISWDAVYTTNKILHKLSAKKEKQMEGEKNECRFCL